MWKEVSGSNDVSFKNIEFYIATRRLEGAGDRENYRQFLWSLLLLLFFCTSIFPFKSTASLRLILLFPSLQKNCVQGVGFFYCILLRRESGPIAGNTEPRARDLEKAATDFCSGVESSDCAWVFSKLNIHLSWNELQKLLWVWDRHSRCLKKRDYKLCVSMYSHLCANRQTYRYSLEQCGIT